MSRPPRLLSRTALYSVAVLIALALIGRSTVADEVIVQINDDHPVAQVSSAHIFESSDAAPHTALSDWRDVTLPHRWGNDRNRDDTSVWYRVTMELTDWSGADLAVYLPKVSMNADLWINGRFSSRVGSMEVPLTRHWNTPLLLTISPLLLRAGPNEVMVRVRALDRHDGGLAPFFVGALWQLEALANEARFWRSTVVDGLATAVLALAFVVAIVWARRPARIEYLYFSIGAIGCAISTLNMSVTSPPMSDHAWEIIMHGSLYLGVASLALFGWQFSGVSTRFRRWVMATIVTVGLVVLTTFESRLVVATTTFVIFAVAASAFIPLLRKLQQQPLTDSLVFGFAALVAVGAGAYDWLIVSANMPYETAYLLPYVWPVLLGAFSWLIAGEYARTQRDLATLNAELQQRIAARETALQATYDQLRAAERAQASAEERARILRDMHDGVGAHLSTALRQIEAGRSSNVEVANTLRDSLDSLKLAIDGMTLPAGDINALLAALRYRLTHRLSLAGLTVQWEVDELPLWANGAREGNMRHLQFLLFELISNVLQHAHASVLRIGAGADEQTIDVTIADNGSGISAVVQLRSCEARAKSIGATLEVSTSTSGTEVRVRIPMRALI